jgi:hypothetical protein
MEIARKGIIDNVPTTILSNIKWYKTTQQDFEWHKDEDHVCPQYEQTRKNVVSNPWGSVDVKICILCGSLKFTLQRQL